MNTALTSISEYGIVDIRHNTHSNLKNWQGVKVEVIALYIKDNDSYFLCKPPNGIVKWITTRNVKLYYENKR